MYFVRSRSIAERTNACSAIVTGNAWRSRSRYEIGLSKRHAEIGQKRGRASEPWVSESVMTWPVQPSRKGSRALVFGWRGELDSACSGIAAVTGRMEWRAASGLLKAARPQTSFRKVSRE